MASFEFEATADELREAIRHIKARRAEAKAKSTMSRKLREHPYKAALTMFLIAADAAMHGLLIWYALASLWSNGFTDHTVLLLIAVAAWSLSASRSAQYAAEKWAE